MKARQQQGLDQGGRIGHRLTVGLRRPISSPGMSQLNEAQAL
jgi:hypothetical protein